MWAGFEWENKVTVHTNIDNLRDYLHHLVTVSCHCFLSDCENYYSANQYEMFDTRKTLTGDCEFLAANLYAKSMFGESALANLSIEIG